MRKTKQATLSRGGVRWPVAPWVKTLSKEAQRSLLQSNAMAHPIKREALTTVAYTYKTAEQFLMEQAGNYAIAAE